MNAIGRPFWYLRIFSLPCIFAAVFCTPANATVLSNGVSPDQEGHFSVDVGSGGLIRSGFATPFHLGDVLVTDDPFYQVANYAVIPNTAFLLAGSDSVGDSLSGASSVGSFTGQFGNQVNWQAGSFVLPGESRVTHVFDYWTTDGVLGEVRHVHYLDADLGDGFADDYFIHSGSAAGGDLTLFTREFGTSYGLSLSGSYNPTQGLLNASYTGHAVDEFPLLPSQILDGSVGFSHDGNIAPSLLPFTYDDSTAYGLADITVAMAWDLEPEATSATLFLSAALESPGVPVPEPAICLLSLVSFAGLGVFATRNNSTST